jgi:hypothetical protein
MGVLGAIAEFTRHADEAAAHATGEVSTDRGAIRLTARAGLAAVEHDAMADPDRRGHRSISLCLPLDDARLAGRTVLTVLGADTEAVREEDRYGILVDLGLGIPTMDACVRIDDPGLLDVLASSDGLPFLADAAVAIAVVAASPHRVFRTALGRIEVYTPIPSPDGRSPQGPHTHLLPHLLHTRRTHAEGVPIPDGWAPVASIYAPSDVVPA